MRPKEAKAIAPWLFEGNYRNSIGPDGEVITFYYSCKWYDDVERRCTNYENRPTVCSEYPWGASDRRSIMAQQVLLPPSCSFNADVGREVVPIELIPKPRRIRSSQPCHGR